MPLGVMFDMTRPPREVSNPISIHEVTNPSNITNLYQELLNTKIT